MVTIIEIKHENYHNSLKLNKKMCSSKPKRQLENILNLENIIQVKKKNRRHEVCESNCYYHGINFITMGGATQGWMQKSLGRDGATISI